MKGYLAEKLKAIPVWRWILLEILFLCTTALLADYYYGNGSLLIHVADILNDPITICYYFLMGILLINVDFVERGPALRQGEMHSIASYFVGLAVTCLIILAMFLATAFLMTALKTGNGFRNVWMTANALSQQGISPLGAVGLSALFLFLRIFALSILATLFCIWGKHLLFGMIGVAGITILDRFFYEIFNIQSPLGITPLEHTRIVFTEAMRPILPGDARVSYVSSILYWVIGIAVLALLTGWLLSRRKSRQAAPREERCI